MLKQLRMKLTLTYVVTTGVLLMAMTASLLLLSGYQMEKQSRAVFQSSVNSVIYKLQSSRIIDSTWLSQLERGNNLIVHIEDNGNPILFQGAWQPQTDRASLIDAAKFQAASDYNLDLTAKPLSVIDIEPTFFDLTGEAGERYQTAVIKIPSSGGWQNLIMLRDTSEETRENFFLGLLFCGIILVSLLLLFLFSWWFSGRAIQPIEKNHKEQAAFVASASHELKSPLAVIRASLSAISSAEGQEREKFLISADRECLRMSRLISDLLYLASSDSSAPPTKMEFIEIDTLLTELYESFVSIAKERDHKLRLSLPDSAIPPLPGDKQQLWQAISVLLDNAISHTPAATSIEISAAWKNEFLFLTVADDGPGIDDDEKSQVFQRFFRGDSSRTDKNHYGLGLSIAKEIARHHQGKLLLTDTERGGCTFTLKLPCSKASASTHTACRKKAASSLR